MAMVTDGGFLLTLPYFKQDQKDTWIAAMSSQTDGFYVIANNWPVINSAGLDRPPYSAGNPMIMQTEGAYPVLFKLKLYRRILPPAGEPQIPTYEETNDYIECQFSTDSYKQWVDQTDPFAGSIEDGEQCRVWLRFVLYVEGEEPVVLVNMNQSGGTNRTDVEEWTQGWIREGDGDYISGVGGYYDDALTPEGEVDLTRDEIFAVIIWWCGGFRLKSTGEVQWGDWNRSTGCGINLSRLGYSLYFLDTEEDPYVDPEDDDDGFSGPGGGDGDHDKTSDDITIPPDPTITATQCGFVTLYNPTLAQIQALAAQINSETFFDTLKNFFEHAQDYIAGLGIIPVQPSTAGPYHPKMGWHVLDVAMPVVTDQYVDVVCGSINVREFYGSSFDYSPATALQLFLPYVGYVNLNTDEVMDKTLSVAYKVDVYNGNCIAFVLANNSIIGQYNANCMQQVPVSSITFDDVIRNSIILAANVGGGLVQGVAASVAGGAVPSGVTDVARMQAQGNAAATIGSGLLDIAMSKPRVERSGSLGSSLGLMGVQKPHLIKIIPRQSLPQDYKTICGYPSNITAKLSQLSGFVQVDKIHLSGISGTDDERMEIVSLLNGGVLI